MEFILNVIKQSKESSVYLFDSSIYCTAETISINLTIRHIVLYRLSLLKRTFQVFRAQHRGPYRS